MVGMQFPVTMLLLDLFYLSARLCLTVNLGPQDYIIFLVYPALTYALETLSSRVFLYEMAKQDPTPQLFKCVSKGGYKRPRMTKFDQSSILPLSLLTNVAGTFSIACGRLIFSL
jgi:hypothetical protein